jgi:arsenate reductase (thioredoxin)
MKTYLFACVHNAGRSQMAAAWFNHLVGPGRARAVSAGTQPGSRVHPEVLDVMRESGIDLSQAQPQLLTDDLARQASLLVTMGCGEACPVVPGLRREDWPLEDPKGKPAQRVRGIRDEVRTRVAELIKREGLGDAHERAPLIVRPASRGELPDIVQLLRSSDLPTQDVMTSPILFLVAVDGLQIVGCVGMELHADVALLRSLVVAPAWRGRGLSSQLMGAVLEHATRAGIREVFLLTTTAATLFARHGFVSIPRESAPESIRQTPEFASICPSSAAFMQRSLAR